MNAGPHVLESRRGRLGGYANRLERAAVAALQRAGRSAGLDSRHELSLVVCDNAVMQRLNRRWRGKDQATDVLSFPLHALRPGAPPAGAMGDILISLPTTRRAARLAGVSDEQHVERLAIHGLAHLLGHDHRTDGEARRMEREEERLLGRKITQ